MIAPAISASTANARLDAMPGVLRAALVEEIGRLGRELRDRLGRGSAIRRRRVARRTRLTVQAAADAVTATLTLDGSLATGLAHSPKTGRHRSMRPMTMRQRNFLHAALGDITPEIRTGLEAAAQQVIRQ